MKFNRNLSILYLIFAKMSWEGFAEIPNKGIKVMKNKQFLSSLAGHKWPQKVVIFGKVKEKGLT